jgi:hypothetical protein
MNMIVRWPTDPTPDLRQSTVHTALLLYYLVLSAPLCSLPGNFDCASFLSLCCSLGRLFAVIVGRLCQVPREVLVACEVNAKVRSMNLSKPTMISSTVLPMVDPG